MKRLSLILAVISGLAYSSVAQNIVRGPYLQSPTDNSIYVKWRTSTATDSKVSYGTDPNDLSTDVSLAGSTTEHSVEISGLQPYTKYYYSVGDASKTMSGPDNDHYFITNPVPGTEQPVRIWAIGDFGKGNQGQLQVKNSYLDYTGNKNTDVWLWLGDNAYDTGTDQEYQVKVFTPFGDVFKHIPFWAAPGNHDYGSICPIPCSQDPQTHSGPYYDIIEAPTAGEAGGYPSGTELYYSFDYGNVHFVSLNSELGNLMSNWDYNGVYQGDFNNSPVRSWLINDLTNNTQPWVIVYFHQPPYTKGSHDSDDFFELYMIAMRENFTPLFDQFGVDLVVCGHSHVYERSYLVKSHQGNSSNFQPGTMLVDGSSGNRGDGENYYKAPDGPGGDGTVYVVCGNSGSNESAPPTAMHPIMAYRDYGSGAYGSFIIDVDGKELTGKYLKANGDVTDEFTILKGDTTVSTAIDASDLFNGVRFYPNPFSNIARLEYSLTKTSDVKISLMDLSGKVVKEVVNEKQQQGTYSYLIDSEEYGLAKGTYFVRFNSGDRSLLEKVVKFE